MYLYLYLAPGPRLASKALSFSSPSILRSRRLAGVRSWGVVPCSELALLPAAFFAFLIIRKSQRAFQYTCGTWGSCRARERPRVRRSSQSRGRGGGRAGAARSSRVPDKRCTYDPFVHLEEQKQQIGGWLIRVNQWTEVQQQLKEGGTFRTFEASL